MQSHPLQTNRFTGDLARTNARRPRHADVLREDVLR
jgi:hypothetical protein